MKFCSQCGAGLVRKVPPGDDRERFVCQGCETIHYQNPKCVVGSIPEWKGKILLCRRAIEPRLGFWTLPAGFLENGESVLEAAVRETLEEAGARVEISSLYTLFNLPEIAQVYILLRARLLDLDFRPGPESLELKLCSEKEIPWDDLAFAAVRETLKLFFRDQKTGHFRARMGDITPSPSGMPGYLFTLREPEEPFPSERNQQ